MAKLNGVDPHSPLVNAEIQEIEEKLEEERQAGTAKWYEVFTGPRMAYRTLLGMALQGGQQLTGANFFFYYGTTIFLATGIDNSFVTSIILGSVNVVCTIAGLWVTKHVPHRAALMAGAAWMAMCFFIFAFVGQYVLDRDNPQSTPTAGAVMIAFTCFFIAAFATTWGPVVWAITAELYPARYRAVGIALATSMNWLANFLISFFTTFITDSIHYFYGLVFAGCCIALFFIVYFFLIESKDRSLEEIDTMYLRHVNPITSSKWKPTAAEDPEMGEVNADGNAIRSRSGRSGVSGRPVTTRSGISRTRSRRSLSECESVDPYIGRGTIS
jgi:SP family sugar:H+ symporter-like MFS transporter